jgi:4-hydroxy-3-methylbut-2-enyl diphosphate reductase
MYNLRVTIDSASGFCFGVVYAIDMAEEILDEEGILYCLGDIVHNDMEVKRLEQKGLVIISHHEYRELTNAKVLIRAHGEPPSTYRTAIENNLTLIDASCPVVLKLQNRINQSYHGGEHVMIFGKKEHAEVIALKGQTNNQATVFMDPEELDISKLPPSVTLYSQTTKNRKNFYQASQKLREMGLEVKAHDTICRQVSNRDDELREFVTRFDRIIFVSGKKSSNGKMLYQVCRTVNPNSHFISSIEEIRKDWFSPNETIGICGATSTPQWLMEDVKTILEEL